MISLAGSTHYPSFPPFCECPFYLNNTSIIMSYVYDSGSTYERIHSIFLFWNKFIFPSSSYWSHITFFFTQTVTPTMAANILMQYLINSLRIAYSVLVKYSFPLLSYLLPPFYPFINTVLFLNKKTHWHQFVLFIYSWVWGHPLEYDWPTRSQTLKKYQTPPPTETIHYPWFLN